MGLQSFRAWVGREAPGCEALEKRVLLSGAGAHPPHAAASAAHASAILAPLAGTYHGSIKLSAARGVLARGPQRRAVVLTYRADTAGDLVGAVAVNGLGTFQFAGAIAAKRLIARFASAAGSGELAGTFQQHGTVFAGHLSDVVAGHSISGTFHATAAAMLIASSSAPSSPARGSKSVAAPSVITAGSGNSTGIGSARGDVFVVSDPPATFTGIGGFSGFSNAANGSGTFSGIGGFTGNVVPVPGPSNGIFSEIGDFSGFGPGSSTAAGFTGIGGLTGNIIPTTGPSTGAFSTIGDFTGFGAMNGTSGGIGGFVVESSDMGAIIIVESV